MDLEAPTVTEIEADISMYKSSPYITFSIFIPGVDDEAKILLPKALNTESQWVVFMTCFNAYINGLRKVRAQDVQIECAIENYGE